MPPSLKCVIESAGQKAQFPPRWFASTYRRKLEVLVDRSSCLTLYQNVTAASIDFSTSADVLHGEKTASPQKHTLWFRRTVSDESNARRQRVTTCRESNRPAARDEARGRSTGARRAWPLIAAGSVYGGISCSGRCLFKPYQAACLLGRLFRWWHRPFNRLLQLRNILRVLRILPHRLTHCFRGRRFASGLRARTLR